MSDILVSAKAARETLARGLNLLQADPNPSSDLMMAAEPIATAMGALHRIERSGGAELATAAPLALNAVRSALGILQSKAATDPRLSQAMETVAGSLALIFNLNKPASAAPQAPVAAQPAPQAPYAPPQPAAIAPAAAYAPQPVPAAQNFPQPWPSRPAPPQPAQAPYAPVPQPGQQAYSPPQQPAQAAYAPAPQPAQHPYAPPQPVQQAYTPAPQQRPAGGQPAPQPQQVQPQIAASLHPPTPDDIRNENLPKVEADLGTHSVTNFYKGLSGNDVVDHGGIFISTYNVPKIGQTLKVHVSLPGGYEFEAIGVVRWTREPRSSMATDIAPPGFGLQFSKISPEARNLVYRYVRNREPMFHDDL